MPIPVPSSSTDLADSSTLTSYQAGDADLSLILAESEVRSYCGWHIYPSKTESVTVNGSGRDVQPLPTLYLTAVSSVSETVLNGGAETVTTLTADTDYDWSQAGYLTRVRCDYPRAWTEKLRGVTVTITHGYADVPPEVQAVVLALANRAQEFGGVDQAGPFRFTASKNSDGSTGGLVLSALEKAVLDRYRIPAQP